MKYMPKIANPNPNVGAIQCTDGRAVHAVVVVSRRCCRLSLVSGRGGGGLTKNEQADADERARKQTRQQMILKFSKGAILHARETSIFKIDAMNSESEQASWCDNEEHKAGALG